MSSKLCQFCTLPATRTATVNGKHYPRLCAIHQREAYRAPQDLPAVMEHDDEPTDSPVPPVDTPKP